MLAVVIYNYFNQRLARIAVELKMYTDEFLELLDDFGPDAGKASEPVPPEGTGDDDDEATDNDPKRSRNGAREAA